MSLKGFVDQTKSFSDGLAVKQAGSTFGPVTTGSRIAYDAATLSQVNDWINLSKISGPNPMSKAGETVTIYNVNHLASWQSNQAPAKGSTLT
jgi:hypothetical protein